ncbi:MAG: hypothetical protein LBK96_02450 [Prevotellaceae bacterium]|jgi:hypothetical protein|nr:hypothetical protein [Prevotellaceae bacterium]
MKTIKFIAVAILSLAVFNSCTENTNLPPENFDVPNWHTENLEVKARDWKLVGGLDEIDSYYEYIFDNFPYVDGIVSVYMYQDFGKNTELQLPLPYTYYGVEILENGEEKYYSIQYSYDIARDGTIALKVHVSDYLTSLFRPDTEHFRVAIVW